MKFNKLEKICKNIFVYLIFFVVSLLSIKNILFENVFVGMRHDWYSAPYPQMIACYVRTLFFIWNSNYGFSFLRDNALYYRLFEYLLDLVVGLNNQILFKIEIAILIFMSGIFMYYLLRKIGVSKFASLVSGLFYMTTPVVFNRVIAGHLGYLFSYALSPLILVLVISGLENKNKFYYIVLAGLIYGISAAQHQFVIYNLLILFAYIFIFQIKSKDIKFIKDYALLLVVVLIAVLLHLFWILPLIAIKNVPIYHLSPLDYHSIISSPDTLESFLMVGYPHPYDYTRLVAMNKLSLTSILVLFIPLLFSLITLMKRQKIEYKIFATFLMLVGIFLTAATKSPFGDLWKILFLNIPLFRIFRETYHSEFLVAFSITILFAFFVDDVLQKIKNTKAQLLVALSLLLILTITAYPVISGDFVGQLGLYKFPKEYKTIYKKLHNDPETYRILFLPSIGPFRYEGKNIYSTFQGWDPMIQSPPKPTFPFVIDRTRPLNRFQEYFIYLLRHGENINNYLSIVNVRYIILRPFCKSLYLYYVPAPFNLKVKWANFNFSKIIKNKYVPISKNSKIIVVKFNSNSKFIQVLNPYCAIGNLELISKLPEKSLKYIAVVYSPIFVDNIINNSKSLLVDNPKWVQELVFSLLLGLNKEKVLEPIALYSNPRDGWAYDTVSWWMYPDIAALTFYYGKSTILTTSLNADTSIAFNIYKAGNYKLFIRVFKNKYGGEIAIHFDKKLINVKTKDKLNKFVWEDLGTFRLNKGEYKIILKNINGFNAVNLFLLVPEKDYYKAQNEVKRLLQNKTVIYLFEAESDLYYTNAKIIKNTQASNGELLTFNNNGKAWQYIHIIKNGTYRLAIRGYGKFLVKIGKHTFKLDPKGNFAYTPLFYLSSGRYELEIVPLTKAKLDVVWLYSTKENKTIQQLFEVKEKPAKVISYKKINPTLWKVKVRAKKPFMLSFAEAYDPLWEARVYKDGKLIEKVRSIPLYSVINGFWINKTGDLEIVIRYLPQDWFELGLKISATTFLFCIGYIFYDWRREKGDRWAKKLENKIKLVIRKIIGGLK